MTRPVWGGLVVTVVVLSSGCGGSERTTPDVTEATSTDGVEATATTGVDSPCGVTLADVQGLLPVDSGVVESATPDAGRCNFTWADGGPRGIDVAFVPGGATSFDVPDGYEPLDGYGDDAYLSSAPGRASAIAFVGNDLYAADVVADGADDDLSSVCLGVLRLALGA